MQLIKVELQIIKNRGEFEHDIRLWNAMLRADKTWENLKDYFEHAHQSLRTTRGKTMKSMAFQHANILTTQVLAQVKAVKGDVLYAIEEWQQDDNMPPEQHTNTATSVNVYVEL